MKIKNLISLLTQPRSLDPDEARAEYALRIILLIMTVIVVIFAFLSVFAYYYSIVLLDTIQILFLMVFLFSLAWIFTLKGHWKKARIIPVGIFFVVAVYGNYVGGIGAPAMLIYVLSMILASHLYEKKMQLGLMAASILFFSLIAGLYWKGLIPPPRTEKEAFQNRVFIIISILPAIGILLRFLISQLERAVRISRGNEKELAAINEELQATNEEFEAQNEELQKVNRDLEKSEENFRTLIESSPEPVVLHREGTILFANRAFMEMIRNNPESPLEETSILDFVTPEKREIITEEYIQRRKDGITSSFYETAVTAGNGTELLCEISEKDVMVDDGPATLVFARDITERKLAEQEKERMQKQLIQAQKMEAVGTLTGGIAHDFNNMLSGIMGSLNMMELILKKHENPDIDTLKKYIETALVSSRRASDTTKQLLTLSRKSELSLVHMDINMSLHNLHRLCQNSFPKSVNLEFNIGAKPLIINADPTQIEQVLLNLCLNASHAMTLMKNNKEKQGGTLTLSADEEYSDDNFCSLHQEARPGKKYIKIEVRDTGVGMDEETRRQIFDPFFTTKKNHLGTGLGLAMVYGIISQHSGFIDVCSEPGEGSCFKIYLPVAEEKPATRVNKIKNLDIVAGSGTILVIDDEKSILHIASGILRECGYTVLTAEGGAEGLEVYARHKEEIDGIILDLSMPGMSGLDALAQLKKTSPGIRVLMASGLMEDEEKEKAAELGVSLFLQKPYTAREISEKTWEMLAAKTS